MYSTKQHFGQSALYAFVASVTMVSVMLIGFFFTEPAISRAQVDSNDFIIQQTIIDETSFLVQPSNVTTSGTINGVTGGNASGTTDFVVQSNNSSGYTVTITFEDNSVGGISAMIGNANGDESIRNYAPAGGLSEPTWGYTASTAAQFAYTVTSDTPTDTDQSFLNNTSACNAGGDQNGVTSATKCWMEPSASPFQIVDRNTAAVSGATTTLEFDITVPSGAVPTPTAQQYTATATLTLTIQ